MGTGEVALSVKHLPFKLRDLSSVPSTHAQRSKAWGISITLARAEGWEWGQEKPWTSRAYKSKLVCAPGSVRDIPLQ